MEKTYIIAEAGVNHNGSLEMALELVERAAEARVDAVKFQTFVAKNLVSSQAPKADYQLKSTSAAESQLEMIRKLELSEAQHEALIEHCRKLRIEFLSTPFDLASLDLLVGRFDLPRLKISSGDLTNAVLLLQAARSGKPVILSSGMSILGEIEDALGVLAFGYLGRKDKPTLAAFEDAYRSEEGQKAIQAKVSLLHCTTEYPTPFEEVNLRAMDTLAQAFGLPIGLSDHTQGITIPLAAVARGARIVEKHFTLDRGLPGPDHKASLEPGELAALARGIREIERAMGSPRKLPSRSELKNAGVARKSLVAAKAIRQGEPFTEENLTVKRPGTGISTLRYWEYLGRSADRDYAPDDLVGA